MDWRIWVGLSILVPITVFGLIRLPKIWAGQDQAMMALGTAALPMSTPLKRGFARGTVVGISGVLLFNRPKFAVPPCYRPEQGAVTMWWQARRACKAK